MIVPIPRSRRASEENVLPLINIVFLLLIFFMIAGALSVSAPFPLDPPATRAAAETDPPRDGIAIAADGRLAFGGQRLELTALAERARSWRNDAAPGDVLAVRADAGASTDRLLGVIDVLREADIETIRLLTIGGAEDR